MINDPLIIKIDENKWRICIADSDVLLFAKGIANISNFDVKIHETDICTLAIQGPKSDSLMKKVFGNKPKKDMCKISQKYIIFILIAGQYYSSKMSFQLF